MSADDFKATLRQYLQEGRTALLWKLEGVSEYDARRPLVDSGTNLLGVVKHVAGVESVYFGATFGRPFPEPVAWMEDAAEVNADMWATADESRESIVALYQRVWAHSDAMIEALDLDVTGRVAWWHPDHQVATLHRILVHMIAETHRHAGHMDLVRELVDGSAGDRAENSNMPDEDREWWDGYRKRLEDVAQSFRQP
jgi:hypothetical protein